MSKSKENRKSSKKTKRDEVDAEDEQELQELTNSEAKPILDKGGIGKSPSADRMSSSGASAFERKGKCVTFGRTDLHKAARKGRVEDVRHQLTIHKPTVIDDDGSTPLHDAAACDEEDAPEILELLCSKCDQSCVNRKNKAGRTALHIASAGSRIKSVEVLLRHNARINDDDAVKNTSLHLAALGTDRGRAAEIVRIMCDTGEADINEPNSIGKTPLHLAAAVGNIEVVRTLLEKGARRSEKDEDGATALHAAAACPDDNVSMEIVRELCKNDPKSKDANENSNQEKEKECHEDDDDDFINRRNATGKTALHVAVVAGKLNMVKALIKYGAKRNVIDKKQRTPLHYVSYKVDDATRGNISQSIIAELCQSSKWSPDVQAQFVNRQDLSGQTALHLAARYGQLKSVEKLLEFKASVGILDFDDCSPLIAAVESKDILQQADILEAICRSAGDAIKSLVDKKSTDGKTALHMAAAKGQLNAVNVLLKYGAKLDIQDTEDNTPLHRALLAHDTSSAADIVKAMCTSNQATADSKYVKQHGDKRKTALHLAAGKGLVDVVSTLLDAGAKLEVTDQDGWTPLHDACTASDEDDRAPSIVRRFCELSSSATFINQRNADGETALHMAARFGHRRTVRTLLQFKPSLEIKDNDGWIPLHSSVRVDPLIVRDIIEVIRSSKQETQKPSFKQFGKLVAKGSRAAGGQTQDLTAIRGLKDLKDLTKQLMISRNIEKVLNEKDNEGRTALHLAAQLNSPDMINELKSLNPEIPDKYSNTPLHVATMLPHSASLRAMLEVFYGPDSKTVDIDHVNANGDSALHVCCREGDVEKFRLLLRRGADLERRGAKSFTVLHRLVEVYVHQPSLQDNVVKIYREIVNHAVQWKCQKDGRVAPKADSDLYNNAMRQVIIYLTRELRVKDLNVLQYASKKGASKLLDEILNTPYVFKDPVTELFDVTYLIPDSVPEILSDDDDPKKPLSCLELIVNSRDVDQAEDVLGIYPFNDLVSKYWVLCRRVYNIFLCCHIIFMSLFTVYCMPSTAFIAGRFHPPIIPTVDPAIPDADNSSTDATTDNPIHDNADIPSSSIVPLYGLFLIWPAIITFMEIISGLEFIYRTYVDFTKSEKKKQKTETEGSSKASTRLSKLFAMGRLLMMGFDYVSHVSALAFSASVLAWYIIFVHGNNHHHYCEAIASVFIFGWMHTIAYVKMFKDWHAFASIFKQIVAKDVTRFAYIFVFVLLSFSFAIHALSMSIYPPVDAHARTLAETIYLTFCLTVTVTVGGLLDVSTEPHYEEAGGNIHLLHIVFAGYICLSTIILLNMLIAMMNSTYSAVRSTRATTWRVESLRTALWVERKLPLIKQSLFLRFETQRQMVEDRPRWYISYTPEQITAAHTEAWTPEEDETEKCLREMKRQLTQLVDRNEGNAGATADTATLNELKGQLTKVHDEQKATQKNAEAQTKSIAQLEVRMQKMQEMCEKLAQSVEKLASKL